MLMSGVLVTKVSFCFQNELPVEKSPTDAYYELLASVVYINDTTTGGNLVGHILAGERYHKRKEGITHKTWYLFNDFAITSTVKVINEMVFNN
jgi:Ubiquitin carboxyl-terminal hydrolase